MYEKLSASAMPEWKNCGNFWPNRIAAAFSALKGPAPLNNVGVGPLEQRNADATAKKTASHCPQGTHQSQRFCRPDVSS
jgi:hypothetical protein